MYVKVLAILASFTVAGPFHPLWQSVRVVASEELWCREYLISRSTRIGRLILTSFCLADHTLFTLLRPVMVEVVAVA